jgi:regulator of protease activity HflC (stomatin/prohibitin superfamily)
MFDAELAPLLIFILILAVVVAFASVKICAQYQRAVVFFLGRYARTSGPGLFLLLPFLEWRSTVDIRTSATSVEEQETITKDNVPVKINAVIWRRVVDPKRSLIEVANVGDSVTQAAVTALRATIGQHTLDEVLKDQDSIAAELQIKLDAVTEPWGVKVEQVQMKNIEIPRPCSAQWRRRPRPCAKNARGRSRPRRSSRRQRSSNRPPTSSRLRPQAANCAGCRC